MKAGRSGRAFAAAQRSQPDHAEAQGGKRGRFRYADYDSRSIDKGLEGDIGAGLGGPADAVEEELVAAGIRVGVGIKDVKICDTCSTEAGEDKRVGLARGHGQSRSTQIEYGKRVRGRGSVGKQAAVDYRGGEHYSVRQPAGQALYRELDIVVGGRSGAGKGLSEFDIDMIQNPGGADCKALSDLPVGIYIPLEAEDCLRLVEHDGCVRRGGGEGGECDDEAERCRSDVFQVPTLCFVRCVPGVAGTASVSIHKPVKQFACQFRVSLYFRGLGGARRMRVENV